ncbi:MAG TPA: SlyX family protein [Rectinemataceae bacterium]|nr:SlyX family protein [Rectinemataceae bacterium]
MDERIEALETRVAYQDRALAELSSELFEASKRIERLEKSLRDVSGKVKDLAAEAEQPAPGDVRPPHW